MTLRQALWAEQAATGFQEAIFGGGSGSGRRPSGHISDKHVDSGTKGFVSPLGKVFPAKSGLQETHSQIAKGFRIQEC